jgi:primosomal protein N' (replication factor Y)
LGLIIIDEEHETTYKSETQPKYHAKEVAIKRAELANASVVLGSATPSLETYYEALKGTYKLIELNNRIDHKALPSVDIVDMRQELLEGNKSMLSDRLRTAIEDRLSKKEQIILFINRRGFARFVSCRNCGCALKCDHCDVAYTYHNTGQLVCHYCGKEINVPSICPECGSKHIRQFGIGTQKVEAYIQSEFKEAKILRMDMDTTSKKNSYEDILTKFSRQEADVLIGTQMVAKGHDFPNVTLVGILAADLSLYMNDFRSSERTFNLLTQVAGRAGRGKIPGEVVVQTYSPEHFSIECAKTQDYKKFYNEEIQYREFMNYPPYSNIMTLLMTSKNENELIRGSELIGKAIEFTLDPSSYEIIGPTAAAIGKINDVYRRILYIKSKEYDMLLKGKKQIETILNQYKQYNSINIQFDFNPLFT